MKRWEKGVGLKFVPTLKKKVNANFVNEMLGFAPLQKMLVNDPDFSATWSELKEEFDEAAWKRSKTIWLMRMNT